jgi:hypothetical protein
LGGREKGRWPRGKRLAADSNLRQSRALVGMPSYLAPEQAEGTRGAVLTATDLESLGVVLHAVVARRQRPSLSETPLETRREPVKVREP